MLLNVFQQNLDMWHFPVHQFSAVLEFAPPLFVHIVNKNGEKLLRVNHKLACLFNHLAENADKHLFLQIVIWSDKVRELASKVNRGKRIQAENQLHRELEFFEFKIVFGERMSVLVSLKLREKICMDVINFIT